MSGQLQRLVTASFAPASGSHPLAIEPDPGFYVDGLVHLLLIPDVGAGLKASVGEARLGNSKAIDIPGGILSFSGSDSASLPAPPVGSAPEFEALFAFDSQGQPTSVGAHYDPAAFEVRLSRACTAAIAYTAYTSRARTIEYQPKVESAAGGSKTTYGVIAAYYQGTLITYQVTPPNIDRGDAVVELYKRYSIKIINGDGQFEKPPGYPQSGEYPDRSMVLDVVGSREIQRVHEVAFLNSEGRVTVFTPTVTILEPYVGDNAYKPTVSCSIATLDPEKFSKDAIARATDFVRSKGLGCKDA